MGLMINITLKKSEQDKLDKIKKKVAQLTGKYPTVITTGRDSISAIRNGTYNKR